MDWKERFKEEIKSLEERITKLDTMLENWDNLDFEPATPKKILEAQLQTMRAYHALLMIRALYYA